MTSVWQLVRWLAPGGTLIGLLLGTLSGAWLARPVLDAHGSRPAEPVVVTSLAALSVALGGPTGEAIDDPWLHIRVAPALAPPPGTGVSGALAGQARGAPDGDLGCARPTALVAPGPAAVTSPPPAVTLPAPPPTACPPPTPVDR